MVRIAISINRAGVVINYSNNQLLICWVYDRLLNVRGGKCLEMVSFEYIKKDESLIVYEILRLLYVRNVKLRTTFGTIRIF